MRRFRSCPAILGFGAVLLGLASASPGTTIIDTVPAWNGSSSVIYFGEPDTATYGQTITTDATDTVLDSFTFYLSNVSANPSTFAAYVMQWDAGTSMATGPVLYTSSPMVSAASTPFTAFTVNPSVTLAPNTEYVLFFNVSNFFDGFAEDVAWGQPQNQDLYAGGEFVFLNNGNNFGALTTSTWTTGWLGAGGDLAFEAVLSPVPEPASLALMGLGAAGLLVVQRRRQAARRA